MLLAPFDAQTLDADPATIYALDADLRITWVNRAWNDFALANGAVWSHGEWGVGAKLMDAVPAVLRPFYDRLIERAGTSDDVVEHDYECSSATVVRRYRMRVLRVPPSGLLVVSSLLQESSAPRAASPDMAGLYQTREGLFVQCSHCRRTRRRDGAQWDWVPEYVTHPRAHTSHGLCVICAAYHYAEVEARDGD